MTQSKKRKLSTSQSDKFKAMAREIGADGSEANLDKMLKKISAKVARPAPKSSKAGR